MVTSNDGKALFKTVSDFSGLENAIRSYFSDLKVNSKDGKFWVTAGNERLEISIVAVGEFHIVKPTRNANVSPIGGSKCSAIELFDELAKLMNKLES